MKNYHMVLIITLLLIIAGTAHSNDGITLDGTIGTAGKLDLTGPDFDIKAEYGKQAGANLFHSFQKFNVYSGESATFSGPGSVQNIIGRVTGGNSSRIDGTMRSTIPGANLYLLNPAGVMFGPNASLDLDGSFHVSTADYLRMGDAEKFHAAPRENDVLSVAAPAAFGFLDNDIAPLTFEGGEIAPPGEDNFGISVSKGKTISAIGGNIEIKKGISYQGQKVDENGEYVFKTAIDENGNPVLALDADGNHIPVMETIRPGNINAPGGRINLAGVASAGEVIFTDSGLDVSSFESMGDITVSDKAVVDVSGGESGRLYIRGENFVSDEKSTVNAKALGDNNGGVIDIRVGALSFSNGASINTYTEESGNAGNLQIEARDISFTNGSSINTYTDGSSISTDNGEAGDAGSLQIEARDISFTDGSSINTYTKKKAGDAGSLKVEARNISFTDGAFVKASAIYKYKGIKGNAGVVNLKASETVSFEGEDNDRKGSNIDISTSLYSEGDVESLFIEAKNISFTNGAFINATVGGNGNGGKVTLKASEAVTFAGESGKTVIHMTNQSESERAGDAATLLIEAENISLTGGARIDATTNGNSDGGTMVLKASETVLVGGENSSGFELKMASTFEQANAGSLLIEARNISFTDGAYIHAETEGQGDAGKVTLRASETVSFEGEYRDPKVPVINMMTQSIDEGAGKGGSLLIEARDISFTDGASVSATTLGSADSGGVTLKASDRILFERGKIEMGVGGSFGGDAVSLQIEARDISFTDGANINVSTLGDGNAGAVSLDADMVSFAGENSSIKLASYGTGYAGFLRIDAKDISFTNGAYIDSTANREGMGNKVKLKAEDISFTNGASINSATKGSGRAGDIDIKADRLRLDTGASFELSSTSAGNAGDLIIDSSDSIKLFGNSSLSTEAKEANGGRIDITVNTGSAVHLDNSRIMSKVYGGAGDAGDIKIGDAKIITLNNSKITADAYKGDGGDIHIAAEQLVQSSDSVISASSQMGIDGKIQIESPDTDPGSGLTDLPDNFIDVTRWLPSACSERSRENTGHFMLRGRDGMPAAPDDWLASPTPAFDNTPDFYENPDFWQSAAGQLFIKGEDFHNKGRFEQAAQTFEHAISLLDTGIHPGALLYLAHAYQATGHHNKALSLLFSALPCDDYCSKKDCRHIKKNSPFYDAMILGSIGDIYLSFGNMGKAKHYLEKAAEQADIADNPRVSASVLNNMGNVFAADTEYQKALTAFNRCLELTERPGDLPGIRSKVLINLIRLKSEIGGDDAQEILNALNNAFLQIDNLPDSHSKALNMVSLSLISLSVRENFAAYDSHLKKIAFQSLNMAKEIAEDMQDTRIISYTYGYLGKLHEEEKNWPKAVELTRRALFAAQERNCPELLYLWQWQLGRLFSIAGDIENALKVYNNAVNTLNSIQGEFFRGSRGKKEVFDRQIRPVYIGLAELLLRHPETGTESTDRIYRAMDTMELLKMAELQDYFQDECVTHMKNSGTKNIPPDTALIYPIPLPDRLELLLTLPGTIKQITVPVKSEYLRNIANRFHKHLQNRSHNRFRKYARELYDILIGPAEKELNAHKIKTLLIAPEGALRLIPFSALYDGNEFLIEKYAVAIIPAITLTDPEPTELKNPRVLLNGLSEAISGFSSLPSVPEELEDIRETMEGKILLDKEYTIGNLTDEFKNIPYSVVHFATHGMFGGNPGNTFLLAYDGRLTMDDLDGLIGNRRFGDDQVELLTLGACQTAIGDERAALGLAGVALKAGAKSAIATLWFIDDKAASLLIREFYSELSTSDISKANALQNAQKKLIRQPGYQHPAYWAPFLLIGNWL